MYTDNEFQQFLNVALNATNQNEIDLAFKEIYKKYPDYRFAISLDDYPEHQFSGIDIRFLNGDKAVIPFFESSKIYFMSDKIFESMFSEGAYNYSLDSSVMLDTNCSSYIKSFMFRDNIGNFKEVINIIHQLLNNKVNFDYLFYLIENYKQVFHLIDKKLSKEVFWSELNKNMKDNLIALELFLSIDRDKYRKNGNDTPQINFQDAEIKAKELAYEFYFSPDDVITVPIRKRALVSQIILYKTILLKFSSRRNAKNKANDLIDFMVNEIGAYADTELFIAIDYFNNESHLSIFNKINKGNGVNSDIFHSKVENISWDLMIPRYVQYVSYYHREGDFFIPFFLTFDNDLSKVLKIYKAKIFIYNDKTRHISVVPIRNQTQKLANNIKPNTIEYFSSEKTEARRNSTISIKKLYSILEKVRLECTQIMC